MPKDDNGDNNIKFVFPMGTSEGTLSSFKIRLATQSNGGVLVKCTFFEWGPLSSSIIGFQDPLFISYWRVRASLPYITSRRSRGGRNGFPHVMFEIMIHTSSVHDHAQLCHVACTSHLLLSRL
jgi:hypothetical protein